MKFRTPSRSEIGFYIKDLLRDNLFKLAVFAAVFLLGAVLGMTFSYWLDRRYVHFDVRAVWWAQVLKAVLGLAITIGLRTVLKAPLLALCGGLNIANLIRYALMVIFAAGIWPMAFGWFGRLGRNKPVPGTSD